MGVALMGTGRASGENRALEATQRAISSPLLEEASIQGARGLLINVTGGPDLTLFEVNEARIGGPAPRVGEHSRAVLRDLGYSDSAIDGMIADKAVRAVG